MPTGDQADMTWRLGKVLPARWFPDPVNAPVLQSVLNGLGSGLAAIYSQISYASAQTRIETATDGFLDIAGLDFLGGSLPRRAGEPDAKFSARIQAEVIRPRATRASVVRVLTDLTGRAPHVFEPANPFDTGGIGFIGMTQGSGLAIGNSAGTTGAGGIGSLELPCQFFVNALRATVGGIPNVGGIYLLPALNDNALTLAGSTGHTTNTMQIGNAEITPWNSAYSVAKHTRVSGSDPVVGMIALTDLPASVTSGGTFTLNFLLWAPPSLGGAATVVSQSTGWVINATVVTAATARGSWVPVQATAVSVAGADSTLLVALNVTGAVGTYLYSTDWELRPTSAWAGGGIGSLSNNGAGAGAMEVTSLSMSQGQITDTDIYAAVASVIPAGGIAWVSITT